MYFSECRFLLLVQVIDLVGLRRFALEHVSHELAVAITFSADPFVFTQGAPSRQGLHSICFAQVSQAPVTGVLFWLGTAARKRCFRFQDLSPAPVLPSPPVDPGTYIDRYLGSSQLCTCFDVSRQRCKPSHMSRRFRTCPCVYVIFRNARVSGSYQDRVSRSACLEW